MPHGRDHDAAVAHWERIARPFPKKRELIPVRAHVTRRQGELLRQSFLPREMEDHWLVLLHGSNLDFYRSWTGYHIFRLRLRRDAAGYGLGPLWVNADGRQFHSSGTCDSISRVDKLLNWLLRTRATVRGRLHCGS